MRRLMPGLYEGPDLRAELENGSWVTEARLRDVGEPVGMSTNIYEADTEGRWTRIGRFRTLRVVEAAGRMLREGTHVMVGPYSNDLGRFPAQIRPFSEVSDEIAARTAPGP